MSKPGCENVQVRRLKEGDMVDLVGDVWADVPTSMTEPEPIFAYEYSTVMEVTVSQAAAYPGDPEEWLLVEFDNATQDFPADHLVPLVVSR